MFAFQVLMAQVISWRASNSRLKTSRCQLTSVNWGLPSALV